MIVVHFCVESFDPGRGGMEESAFRLIHLLSAEAEIAFVVYVFGYLGNVKRPLGIIDVIDIGSRAIGLLEPLGKKAEIERAVERARLKHSFLRNSVIRVFNERSSDRHIFLSFYLSTAGFVAQHVASDLGIPHIACSRGSDLGRDILTQMGIIPVEFVVKRAFTLVTTNHHHRRLAENVFNRSTGVHVIYNSLPPHIHPTWSPQRKDRVRLISLCGYSLKKGTNFLLEAVARLVEEGLPIHLEVCGPTGPGDWKKLRARHSRRLRSSITLKDLIDRRDVESVLLGKDIYCSASLSEGCSNATMLALGMGMPIVSTATGALVDLGSDLSHVAMAETANTEEFTATLRRHVKQFLDGTLQINREQLQEIVSLLSPERERNEWISLIKNAAMHQTASARK